MLCHKKVNLSLHTHYARCAILSPLSNMEGAYVPNMSGGGEVALPSEVLASVWASEKLTGYKPMLAQGVSLVMGMEDTTT